MYNSVNHDTYGKKIFLTFLSFSANTLPLLLLLLLPFLLLQRDYMLSYLKEILSSGLITTNLNLENLAESMTTYFY